MTSRYTNAQKQQALEVLAACEGRSAQASAQTGIPESTLRYWEQVERDKRVVRLSEMVERLQEQLIENAIHLAGAMERALDGAPLNQIASALGMTVDRYLKLREHIGEFEQAAHRERPIQFQYPDGSIYPTLGK
jgi:hypothetical protein